MIAFRRWKRNSYSEFFRVIEVDGLDHPVPITRRTSIQAEDREASNSLLLI